jgi:hypothetical protein
MQQLEAKSFKLRSRRTPSLQAVQHNNPLQTYNQPAAAKCCWLQEHSV